MEQLLGCKYVMRVGRSVNGVGGVHGLMAEGGVGVLDQGSTSRIAVLERSSWRSPALVRSMADARATLEARRASQEQPPGITVDSPIEGCGGLFDELGRFLRVRHVGHVARLHF